MAHHHHCSPPQLTSTAHPPLLTSQVQAAAAAALVCLLSQASFGGTDGGTTLANRIWKERYADLELPEDTPSFDVVRCSSWARELLEWLRHAPASEWAASVARHAAERLPAETRGSWLSNLAEFVAAEQVGVAHVHAFWQGLSECVDEFQALLLAETTHA